MRWLALGMLVGLAACRSNGDFHDVSTSDAFGQAPPGLTARLFLPGVVSTEHGELNAVFSPDQQEFYFTRRGIPGRWPAILMTSRGPEGWSLPREVGFDPRYSAIDLFITEDGRELIFCSNRPRALGGEPKRDHDFWISARGVGGWGDPRPFAPAAQSEFEDYYPIVTRSRRLYFNSQREGAGANDIFWASPTAGRYGPAVMLPAPINSEFREFDAYVSPDEDLIVFSSDRPGGFGRADIYVSTRGGGGDWCEPRNLGAGVNSPAAEYGAMPSPDGRFLFFTSTRGGGEDIYWISAEVLGASSR